MSNFHPLAVVGCGSETKMTFIVIYYNIVYIFT